MDIYNSSSTVIITCNKRLTPYLEQEVKELNFVIEESFITGLRVNCSVNDCIKLNLSLRCASQVLYSVKKFRAANADDVYRELSAFEWETLLDDDVYFSVTSNVDNPTINNSLFANLRVKDAIVDRLREKRGVRPLTGADLDGAVIHLYWKNEQAEIFLDTSGNSLARHGYRKAPGRAPMLEALACAAIMATKWNRSSPFVNPMCGSGTLAIEAALLATNTRPGLFRSNYAFMHFKRYDESVFLQQRGLLENQINDNVKGLRIIATDYSEQAISNARKNAAAAGVLEQIEFALCDFADSDVPQGENGVLFINPEYGERLGVEEELALTYRRIGDFMKQKCMGYFGYIFTGNPDLAKKIGLKASRKLPFYTSTIDCRLLEYELYEGKKAM